MTHVLRYPSAAQTAPSSRYAALRWSIVGCAVFWTAIGASLIAAA